MQQLNITGEVAKYARAAELERPIKEGDWRDAEGLLHCGVCRAYLEHRVRENRVKRPANMTVDEERAFNQTLSWFLSRTFRVPCLCKEKERRAYEKRQFDEMVKENRYHCFGKTPELMNCVFERDDTRDSRTSYISRRYAENFGKSVKGKGQKLLYWGEVGHGKTFMACAVANAVITQGYSVKYTSFTKIMALAAQYSVPLQSIIEGLYDYDLIVIDDFGTEEIGENKLKKTQQIINALNERNIALVITTNIPPERFNAPASDDERRIFSRMLDRCTRLQIKHEGGDRRLRNGT